LINNVIENLHTSNHDSFSVMLNVVRWWHF